jgi:hypothetical protein
MELHCPELIEPAVWIRLLFHERTARVVAHLEGATTA